ncbi:MULTISPECIES: SRPBCC domain-containing protein [Marinobacter]|uniref:ATPase n=1 Tax=Marinobacter profundi TaxID=2666256 RepID=A0A2G1UMP2_9GAMM|nr:MULTISPECIES: SRPBCC domain-containing protein [Marinobacter]MBD3657407.1 SRPBCC domain-containing protein [Marinobacter sp.]PHQ15764.1 ATPase [Marinobacter profundi]
MTTTEQPWGTLRRDGDRVRASLQRRLDHDPARVWEMLTDSVCLANWLAPGVIEPRKGGIVKLDFGRSGTPIDCRVRAIRAPELLEYSWSAAGDPERPIRWELIPEGSGTLLQLTLLLPDDELVAISCAGWDAHLEMLTASLEGIHIHFPADRFRQARCAFGEMVRARLAA